MGKRKKPSIEEQATLGSPGSILSEPSLAAERLLVSGKGDLPELVLRQRRRSSVESGGRTDSTAVIGSDRLPWRMICSIEIFSFTKIPGTAWFVGPKTLITAGHCVFDKDRLGGRADRIIVYPGRYDIMNEVFPFPRDTTKFTKPIVSTRFEAAPGWEDHQSPDQDYAVIQLDEPAGEETGWFSVALKDDVTLKDHLANIAGYPVEQDEGRDGRVQYYNADKIDQVTPTRLFYKIDTAGGQSGSPVWIQNSSGDAPQVVGIHTNGDDNRSFRTRGNSARRIDAEVFGHITQWLEEAKT